MTTCGRGCSVFADGANRSEPLVETRAHSTQASLRRSDVEQESFQRGVVLREIVLLAPGSRPSPSRAGLGSRDGPRCTDEGGGSRAARSCWLRSSVGTAAIDGCARRSVVCSCAGGLFGDAARLIGRRRSSRPAGADVIRVAVRPARSRTPYRVPLFYCVVLVAGIDLTVIYAAHRSLTVRGRSRRRTATSFCAASRGPKTGTASPPSSIRSRRGSSRRASSMPESGRRRCLRLEHVPALQRADRLGAVLHHVPYVILVESHDPWPRTAWC